MRCIRTDTLSSKIGNNDGEKNTEILNGIQFHSI